MHTKLYSRLCTPYKYVVLLPKLNNGFPIVFKKLIEPNFSIIHNAIIIITITRQTNYNNYDYIYSAHYSTIHL